MFVEQNLLYIIIAVIMVVVIIIAVFIRRRRTGKGPKNVNQFLAHEAELKKMEIVERESQSNYGDENVLLKGPRDKLKDIQKGTSEVMHKIFYFNSKIFEKGNILESELKHPNLEKQLKNIEKKNQKLNKTVNISEKGK